MGADGATMMRYYAGILNLKGRKVKVYSCGVLDFCKVNIDYHKKICRALVW